MIFFCNIFFSVFVFSLVSVHLKAMNHKLQFKTRTSSFYDYDNTCPSYEPQNRSLKSIKDIPAYYANLAKLLVDQSSRIRSGKNSHFGDFQEKTIALDNDLDCEISIILFEGVVKAAEEAWAGFYDVESDENYLLTFRSYSLPTVCGDLNIENIYKETIQTLQYGWGYIRDSSDGKSSLFVKKRNLFSQEAPLICYLAEKFGLGKIIKCKNSQNNIYLWVKKNSIDAFNCVFHFEIFDLVTHKIF